MTELNPRQAALNGAMIRFRIMAIYAGVLSLLLWFVSIPTHYFIFKDFHQYVSWISLLHGFTYPIYVFAAFLPFLIHLGQFGAELDVFGRN
jgi:hypothetical protein